MPGATWLHQICAKLHSGSRGNLASCRSGATLCCCLAAPEGAATSAAASVPCVNRSLSILAAFISIMTRESTSCGWWPWTASCVHSKHAQHLKPHIDTCSPRPSWSQSAVHPKLRMPCQTAQPFRGGQRSQVASWSGTFQIKWNATFAKLCKLEAART